MERHGDEAMGFPHDKTTHHFLLYSDGGAIEVSLNDNKDSENLQAISERFANHRLVTGGRTGEGCDSSQVTNLPLVGQPIG